MKTHVIRLPTRTVQLRIWDLPDLVAVELACDAYGEEHNDDELVTEWLAPIVADYSPTKRLVFLRATDIPKWPNAGMSKSTT